MPSHTARCTHLQPSYDQLRSWFKPVIPGLQPVITAIASRELQSSEPKNVLRIVGFEADRMSVKYNGAAGSMNCQLEYMFTACSSTHGFDRSVGQQI